MQLRKRSLMAAIVLGTLIFSSSLAGAADTQVIAGALSGPGASTLALSSIGALNLSATQTATGTESITVADNRGSGAGWRMSVAATNFQATGITDPTVGAATLTVTLPVASVLTANVTALSSTQGQDTTSITQTSSATAVTTGGITLLSAATGYGMGTYNGTLGYTFTLPKTVAPANIVSSNSTTSTYKSGHSVTAGIFAGTYSTTVTYTTSNTP